MKVQSLKKIRIRKGIKASWVASELGLSASYLCLCESGQRPMSRSNWLKYKKLLAK